MIKPLRIALLADTTKIAQAAYNEIAKRYTIVDVTKKRPLGRFSERSRYY